MLQQALGRVGAIEIGRVLDGSLIGETMQTWFPDFDRDRVRDHEHWLCPDHFNPETGHFSMPVHSWVLQVGKSIVLIDTCMGNHKDRPAVNEMHMLDTRYLERLKTAGIRPEDVDYVLCTHLHVDHVGWNTTLENGRWVPTFPNAKYVMSRTEYEAAKADAANPAMPAFIRNVFEDSIYPVVEAGKDMLVDGVHELLDCLTVRPAPGHSPGHVQIEVRSGGALGIFSGDMLHSPVQIPFWQWSSKVCWDKAMSAQARHALLDLCASENALLLAGHFEAPHVSRIKRAGDGFLPVFGWS